MTQAESPVRYRAMCARSSSIHGWWIADLKDMDPGTRCGKRQVAVELCEQDCKQIVSLLNATAPDRTSDPESTREGPPVDQCITRLRGRAEALDKPFRVASSNGALLQVAADHLERLAEEVQTARQAMIYTNEGVRWCVLCDCPESDGWATNVGCKMCLALAALEEGS